MGYDLERFQGEVDKELCCPICAGVLKDPLQASTCEHTFCRACINEASRCPLDSKELKMDELRAAPKIIRNFLSRLSIACDYAANGCTLVVKLGALQYHLKECEYDPEKPLSCEFRKMILTQQLKNDGETSQIKCELKLLKEKNCGFDAIKNEVKHDVSELRKMILTQQHTIDTEIKDIKWELKMINEKICNFHSCQNDFKVRLSELRAMFDALSLITGFRSQYNSLTYNK